LRFTVVRSLDPTELERLRTPRDDIVGERLDGDGRFVEADGPFVRYERTVVDGGPDPTDPTLRTVEETVDFALPNGTWRFLMDRMVGRALRRPPKQDGRMPWWAPPQRPDPRAATVLGLLATLTLVIGYLGTLLGQTMTFAAEEFGATKTAQSLALAFPRAGLVLAITVTAFADRQGRRRVLRFSVLGCIATTALGALSPNLATLAGTQVLARGTYAASALVLGILVVEEMPAGSRAFAVSLLSATGALGAGIATSMLWVADINDRAWRLLFVFPLLVVPAVLRYCRLLPESRRFERPHTNQRIMTQRSRLILVAGTALLWNIFVGPVSQFRNDYLNDERHFSAGKISLFVLATNTPAGIGIVAGGRMAESIGRRKVGGIAAAVSALLVVVSFNVSGSSMWISACLGSIVGAALSPAFVVYWAELFPTSLRGQANGIISATASVGSVIGLLLAGPMTDSFGSFGPTIALLSSAQLVMALLLFTRFPETAHRELEDINPSDQLTGAASPGGGAPHSSANPSPKER
jgi:MFS family permease